MIKQTPIKTIEWVDMASEDIDNIYLSQNKVTVKGPSNIYSRRKITDQYVFTVVPNFMNLACVGVKNIKSEHAGPNTGYQDQDSILFFQHGKGLNQEGTPGFRSGDKVRFSVNLKEGSYRIEVNEQKMLEKKEGCLKKVGANWVPFVFLQQEGDYAYLYE